MSFHRLPIAIEDHEINSRLSSDIIDLKSVRATALTFGDFDPLVYEMNFRLSATLLQRLKLSERQLNLLLEGASGSRLSCWTVPTVKTTIANEVI